MGFAWLYPGPKKINSAKVADLKELLSYVPPVHHALHSQSMVMSNLDSENEVEADDESDMESDDDTW